MKGGRLSDQNLKKNSSTDAEPCNYMIKLFSIQTLLHCVHRRASVSKFDVGIS